MKFYFPCILHSRLWRCFWQPVLTCIYKADVWESESCPKQHFVCLQKFVYKFCRCCPSCRSCSKCDPSCSAAVATGQCHHTGHTAARTGAGTSAPDHRSQYCYLENIGCKNLEHEKITCFHVKLWVVMKIRKCNSFYLIYCVKSHCKQLSKSYWLSSWGHLNLKYLINKKGH